MLLGLLIDALLFGGCFGALTALAARRPTLGLAPRLAIAWAPSLAVYGACALTFFALMLAHGELSPRVVPEPGLPAANAGVQEGDVVVSLGGEPVSRWDEIRELNERLPKGPRRLEVQRGDQRTTVWVTPGDDGKLGLRPQGELAEVKVAAAAGRAALQPVRAIAAFLGQVRSILFESKPAVAVGGPVMLYRVPHERSLLSSVLPAAAASASVAWPSTLLASAVLSVVALERRRARPGG